jgi:endonuclease/exonuclease/phosphatase family metal-dependent hydrolase
MKVLSLNIWGGHEHQELLQFIKSLNNKIDVFCFQEVFKSEVSIFSSGSKMDIYSDLEKILKGYQVFYAPTFANYDLKTKIDFDAFFGEATFVKNSIRIISEGTVFTYKKFDDKKMLFHDDSGEYWDLPRNFHYVIVKNKEEKFLIINIHGFWKPGSKEDTKESLQQSDKILQFLNSQNSAKIVCGDFNLNPKTESIKKLENGGLINLIKQHNITNTRSKFYARNEKFADYILVSPDVKVNEFRVINAHVSDHLPLFLDFA